jgi:uncharacterized protein YdbL (DUF1318 family)
MMRRILTALTLGLALAAGTAQAQSAGAKATVDAAKAQGTVGEQADGFLGIVGGADSSVRAAVAEINSGRTQAYQDIAAKTGVTPAAAGEATAQQLIGRLAPGSYYKPLNGSWTRK